MTRSQLIKKIYNSFPNLTHEAADVVVRVLLDEMVAALVKGDRIEVRGFGSFKVSHRLARTARNPRNGAKVQVPEKFVPRFRASKELLTRMNLAMQQNTASTK